MSSRINNGNIIQPPSDLALVVSHLGNGGAQRVVVEIANEFLRQGLNVSIITMAPADADFFLLEPAVRRIVVGGLHHSRGPAGAIVANIQRLWRLRRALRQTGAPSVLAFVGTINVLTVLASVGLNLRVVISERNDPARQSLGPVWDRLRRMVYRRAEVVTVNSHQALAVLSEYVPKEKLELVSNPVVMPTVPALRGDARTILSVGRLTAQKGFDVLFDAFAKIAVDSPGWRLAIVGDGPEEADLKRQAASLGIGPSIDWLGTVRDPGPAYRRAAFFVLASRYEGASNAVMEAMSFALPVAVTDQASDAGALVENGVTGLVVPAEDSQALAEAMSRLIRDERLCIRLGEAARSHMKSQNRDLIIEAWRRHLNLPLPRPATFGRLDAAGPRISTS